MQQRDYPRVYIILLNWNNYADTKRCLDSLATITYPNFKTIVVDNGSTDGSGQQLQAQFPYLRFIFNAKNLGFSKGCNTGIREALEDSQCAYVLLLNNDAVVSAQFLESAVKMAESDSRIGLVGGKIFQALDSNVLSYAGGYVSRWRGQTIVRGFGEVDQGKFEEPCETGFIIGALMLIKREVLESVGALPEEYFFGVEDLDYSLTVQTRGYKLYYVPQFIAYHLGGGSQFSWEPQYLYNSYRGKLILLQKHLPFGLFPIWKILLAIYTKFVARRRWKQLAKKYEWSKDKRTSYADMEFAALKAIKDHGKDRLCEESLIRFTQALNKERQKQT
jgi:GT2 family glycosyltransferase